MQDTFRHLSDSLADLLGLDRRQPIQVILGAVIGLIALNWFSASLRELGMATFGPTLVHLISLAALPLLVIYLTLLFRRRAHRAPDPVQPIDGQPPVPARGIILFLSSFRTFPNKLPDGLSGEVWTSVELIEAVEREDPKWPSILDHVMASNMQIPIEAVKYHHDAGSLAHVWIISTADVTDADGSIVSDGSYRVGAALARILREGFGMAGVTVHHREVFLHVSPHKVEESFNAVSNIYLAESQRTGLTEADIVADITAGTTTMKMGMLLAAGLAQRPLQFTATQNDPVYGNPLDQPKPYAIALDDSVVRNMVLERMIAVQEDV